MNHRRSPASWAVFTVLVCGLVAGLSPGEPQAADHTDPPSRVAAGDPADIGDLYAWHHDDRLSVVLTFAGPVDPVADQMGTYDRDVLYGIHIDNDGDGTADHVIWVRFGQNGEGAWGMQVINFPGADTEMEGPVGTANEIGPVGSDGQFYAGLHEDPFFFDLAGFDATVANVGDGDDADDLAFTGADFFAGKNITAIVLDIPLAAALGGNTSGSIWATTSTVGG